MRSIGLAVALALASLSCGDRRISIAPPWPVDEVAVAVLLDLNGAVVIGPEIVQPGEPLELRVDTRAMHRLLVRTYPTVAAGGPDFESCGIAIGGEGGVAPEPSSSWISDPLFGRSLELMEEKPPTVLDVRLPRCSDDPTIDCRAVILNLVPISITGNFSDVAFPTDDVAFALLRGDFGPERTLLRWEKATNAVSVVPLAVDAVPSSLAKDRSGVTWVGLVDGRVLGLDASGGIVRTVESGIRNPKVTAGEETVLAYSTERAVEIVATATIAAPRDDIPEGAEDLFVVGADRMIAMLPGLIAVLEGGRWAIEHRDDQVGEFWFGFGDRARLGAIGDHVLLRRDELSQTWSPVSDPPTGQFNATGAAVLGNNRTLVIAEVGYAGLIVGDRPCQLEAGTLRPLRGVDVAPGGELAMIVGENRDPGSEPVMAVVDLSGLSDD